MKLFRSIVWSGKIWVGFWGFVFSLFLSCALFSGVASAQAPIFELGDRVEEAIEVNPPLGGETLIPVLIVGRPRLTESGRERLLRRISDAEARHWLAYLAAGYDTLQLWNVGFGFVVGGFDADSHGNTDYRGALIELTPGLRGWKVSTGFAVGLLNDDGGVPFGAQVAFKAVAFGSWREAGDFHPWVRGLDLKPGQVFAGGEFGLVLALVRFGVGTVKGVYGADVAPAWVFYASAGIVYPF